MRERVSNKEIFGWAMFDFANQAYVLLIITVIFPVLFTSVIAAEKGYRVANLAWSAALASSYLMVVISGPFIGALMDSAPLKKKFLLISCLITVFASALMYILLPGMVFPAMLLLVISNFAYSTGENIIASFLPSLGPPQELGRISGIGWSLGYLGGLFAAGFGILFLGEVSAANYARLRLTGPFAALFFLLAALPTFIFLKEPKVSALFPREKIFKASMLRVRYTLNNLREYRDLFTFYFSLFFLMAGVYIVITYTFIYGEQVVGWSERGRVVMFGVVQLSAAFGALFFGFMQDKIGLKKVYVFTLLLWIIGILSISSIGFITRSINSFLGRNYSLESVFVLLGLITGISLGASQSAGRAIVGVFTPASKAAEFFGFWGLFNKFAGFVGIIGMGLLQAVFGLRLAILFCAFLFAAALIMTIPVNISRGIAAAGE